MGEAMGNNAPLFLRSSTFTEEKEQAQWIVFSDVLFEYWIFYPLCEAFRTMKENGAS